LGDTPAEADTTCKARVAQAELRIALSLDDTPIDWHTFQSKRSTQRSQGSALFNGRHACRSWHILQSTSGTGKSRDSALFGRHARRSRHRFQSRNATHKRLGSARVVHAEVVIALSLDDTPAEAGTGFTTGDAHRSDQGSALFGRHARRSE
jgi:hypothetical protein